MGKKLNLHIVVIAVGLLLVNVPSVQIMPELLEQLYFRKFFTILVIMYGLLFGKKCANRDHVYVAIVLLIVIDTFFLSMLSDTLDVAVRFNMFLRLVMPFVLILIVPKYIYKETDLNKVFMFVIFSNLILVLTGPLQAMTGEISKLYPYENWSLDNARGGLRRFGSILGDPNVGGIIGGLSPIFVSAISKKSWKTKSIIFFLGLIILLMAQSFTGFLCFLYSSFVSVKKKKLFIIVSLVFLINFVIVQPNSHYSEFLNSKVFAAIQKYTEVNNDELASDPLIDAPGILPHNNRMLKDLDFRFFAYLDINNTFSKILFGTAYNKVTIGKQYNPNGKLCHNSYKEMYLAGGLTQLFLYLTMFLITARKAFFLKFNKNEKSDSMIILAMCASKIYVVMLLMMFVFPIYTCPGVGQIFWISICTINTIHDRFQKPDLKIVKKKCMANR